MKMEHKKTMDNLRRIPLPFKMKKYKETDFHRHIILLKVRKDKKSKTITHISNSNNEKNKEIQKHIEDINKNLKLRENKKYEVKKLNIIKKKYKEIPIIPHNSEIPSITTEEITAGKLYPTIYTFKSNKIIHKTLIEQKLKFKSFKKNYKSFHRKLYRIKPIIEHESEAPTIAIEEINAGKMTSIIFTSVTNYQKQLDDKIEYINKNKNNKKYIEIPIISHESESPTIAIEEINSGKMASIIFTSVTNYQKHLDDKKEYINKNKINKKYIEIPIITHDSEKPYISIEEINGGKINSLIQTSVTTYNKHNYSKQKLENNLKKKNYIEIPIISHESEKPSIAYEEINSVKTINIVQNIDENLDVNNISKSKKEKYKEINIVIHESPKPTMVFEEISAGKLYSNINNLNLKKKKYKDIPIIIHDSEKPSITFEESNTGIPITLRSRFIF